MQTINARDVVQDYVDAIGARDLARCVDVYDEQATVEYGPSTVRGKKALEEWHKERFANGLHIVSIDDVTVDGDTVTVEGAITSNRLKAWRIGTLAGRATFQISNGKIVDLRFHLRHDFRFGIFRSR